MSQYNSSMFSDAVYLFGKTFSPASPGSPSEQGGRHFLPLPIKTENIGTRFECKLWLAVSVLMGSIGVLPKTLSEELPDGTKVNQKELAEQVVLAAFAHLYNKKLLDIDLGERNSFFGVKKTAKVKKLQSSAPDTSGLEAVIFSSIRDNSDIYRTTRRSMVSCGTNPWGEVLEMVINHLLDRRLLKVVEFKKREGSFPGDVAST